MLHLNDGKIVLSNKYVELCACAKTGKMISAKDKVSGLDMLCGEGTLFGMLDSEKKEIPLSGITLKGDVFTVSCEKGSVDIQACVLDDYMTFEVMTAIPEGVHTLVIAHAVYQYDSAEDHVSATGVALTIAAIPLYYTRPNIDRTGAHVCRHLEDVGAKYALIMVPGSEMQATIKKACLTIDKNKGVFSTSGGAWGRDARINFSNYVIVSDTSREFLEANIDFYKSLGVDQMDFHQGPKTIRQGDFKFQLYKDGADFKKNVSDFLEEHGMTSGLHTYACYIAPSCDYLLADPKWQKDIGRLETFTLSDDIEADSRFIMTDEPTKDLNPDYGFFAINSYYMLIDEEIIVFDIREMKGKGDYGIQVQRRGACGTKAVPHKKGAKMEHLEGKFAMLFPRFGSELFYEVARLTAKAYNEGGFKMIYLDALDGIYSQAKRVHEDICYYGAAFVREILKYTKIEPLIEYSCLPESLWVGRGRTGAWDTPFRAYKNWNLRHTAENVSDIKRYMAPTLGWYNYYPLTERYPGNEHTKYHHLDAIDHMGSLAIMYDFSTTFNSLTPDKMERTAGMRRNIARYKIYDDLRKAQYFSEEYRQKLINGKWEYHLVKKRGGVWRFVEKHYQMEKFYDLKDAERNFGVYTNPFRAQVPFIRIEALLSTDYQNPFVMMELDEHRDLVGQATRCDFGREVNLIDKLAKRVRVLGNGKKGGKICIKTRCATNSERGFGEYIIDTDFEGWREFILLEADNGERTDHNFEKKERLFAIYRSGLNSDRMTSVELEFEGDLRGVRMSSIVAYEHTYEVLKNPTVQIGDEQMMFECELMSSDFIEFDGKEAKVIDRYGNEKKIWYDRVITAPKGKFKASLTAQALNRSVLRAQLTLGFTGKEIK